VTGATGSGIGLAIGEADGGITVWAAASIVSARFAAAEAVDVTIDCTRSPVSPGLPMRTEIATLHDVQTVMPARSIDGGGAAHAQCQFRTIVVAPGGGAGTSGTPSPPAQFQYQFQTKVCETVVTGSGIIPFELSAAVLPVSLGVFAGSEADAVGGVGVVGSTGGAGGDGDDDVTVAGGSGEASALSGVGGIAGGIVGETGGITGVSGTVGSGGGCGVGATCGSVGELMESSAVAMIAAGSAGLGTPSSARAGLAASAATVPHTARPRAIEVRPNMIQGDMYPPSQERIRKN
jgi:hypothetical protein